MNESEVFLDRLGCLFNRDGRGHDYVYAAFLGKLVHLCLLYTSVPFRYP